MAGPGGKKEKVDKADKAGTSGKKKKDVKKETGLGLSVKKDENFGEWYSEVCLSSKLFCFIFCSNQVCDICFFVVYV